MNNPAVHRERSADKEEISIHLDADLLNQIKHLTNDPSKVIETAIRQWLRGERERDDELTRTLERNPPVPRAANGTIELKQVRASYLETSSHAKRVTRVAFTSQA